MKNLFFVLSILCAALNFGGAQNPPPHEHAPITYDFLLGQIDESFDPDYQAILADAIIRGWTPPSMAQRVLQNQFMLDLKTSGVWDLLDYLWVFATDGDHNYATINWKDVNGFHCIEVGGVTFTTNEGFSGNGSDAFLITQVLLDAPGLKYTTNSAGVFHYVNNDVLNNLQFDYGVDSSNELLFNSSHGTGKVVSLNSGAASTATPVSSGIGFYLNNRTGNLSTQHHLYKDGLLYDATLTNSSGVPLSINYLYLLCRNNNGTADRFTTREISVFGLGESMQAVQADLFTAWNTYRTGL